MVTDPQKLNQQQVALRTALEGGSTFEQAIGLCLRHHAALHSAKIGAGVEWSYEDEILDGLSAEIFRRILPGEEHSIAWCIWHLARIEDTALNLLVARSDSVFESGGWFARLGVPFHDSGNEMPLNEMILLSAKIDLTALREYRAEVGSRTQEILSSLKADDLKRKVDPQRIRCVLERGFIRPEAQGIADYWGKRDVAGLLRMPATRHNLTHLNEAARLKKKTGR